MKELPSSWTLARTRRSARTSNKPLKKVAEMVPELTTCDECGRTVIVLCWGHDTDDAAQLHAVRDSNDQGISCTIDCPACGTRIQTVETLPLEPRD